MTVARNLQNLTSSLTLHRSRTHTILVNLEI